MLGKALVNEFKSSKVQGFKSKVIPTDLPNLDITHSEATEKIISLNPTVVVHLAAYTDVDRCELEPERAWQVNSIGTKNVATACKELKIPIFYISTDYVFDGEKPIPYVEWDSPNPLNIYGQTKLEGELWVKKLVKNYWIIRTSGLYGKGGTNFVTTILKKAKEFKEIKVVDDQIGSPSYTKDIAEAIIHLITRSSETGKVRRPCLPGGSNFGVYHITNSGWVSWYEFAKTIVGKQCKILPISSDELDRPARRPRNFRLLNFMWERVFKTPLRSWKEALNEYLTDNR